MTTEAQELQQTVRTMLGFLDALAEMIDSGRVASAREAVERIRPVLRSMLPEEVAGRQS